MNILHIIVNKKIATYLKRDGDIVCGNSDYQVKFTFDEEWAEHEEKTARFIWGGQYFDVDFTGDTCPVPVITNTHIVKVGVYAGDLETTTAAFINCKPSVLCGGVVPNPGTGQHYTNEAKQAAEEAKKAAEEAKAAAEAGGGGSVNVSAIPTDVIHSIIDGSYYRAVIYVAGIEFTIDKGMTWGEFIDSNYNPKVDMQHCFYRTGMDGSFEFDDFGTLEERTIGGVFLESDTSKPCVTTDVIVAGASYVVIF